MIEYFLDLNGVVQALIATIFTWLLTLLGSALVFIFKNVKTSIMNILLGISGGIMLAASFFSLILPALEMDKNWLMPCLGIFLGGVCLYYSEKVFKKISNYQEKFKNDSFKRSLFLIFAITLHNIPEGLAVGVAFGSCATGHNEIISAVLLALGIGIQNFPEGAAVSLPLKREGYSAAKSFFYGQLSGIVEPIAGIVGALLAINVKQILPFLLSFAAGAMLFVVIMELIPESQHNKNNALVTLFTLFGFTIMMVLDVSLG